MFERVVETLLFPTRIADSLGRLVAEIEPVADDIKDIRLSVDAVPHGLASVDAQMRPVSASRPRSRRSAASWSDSPFRSSALPTACPIPTAPDLWNGRVKQSPERTRREHP